MVGEGELKGPDESCWLGWMCRRESQARGRGKKMKCEGEGEGEKLEAEGEWLKVGWAVQVERTKGKRGRGGTSGQ